MPISKGEAENWRAKKGLKGIIIPKPTRSIKTVRKIIISEDLSDFLSIQKPNSDTGPLSCLFRGFVSNELLSIFAN